MSNAKPFQGRLGFDANNNRVTNVAAPALPTDAVTLDYFETHLPQVDLTFTQNGVGAVSRPITTKLKDSLSVKDFGAIGDGLSHPLSQRYSTLDAAQAQYVGVPITSLSHEIDWAATQAAINHARITGASVFVPAGTYISRDTINQWAGVKVNGEGPLDSPATYVDMARPYILQGSNYLFAGTGPKVHKANLAACNGTTTGDRHVNISAKEPGYDSDVRLTSFWNSDANPTTGAPATQRLFSCGWKIQKGGNCQLNNIGLLPYHDGISGYNLATPVWADDWDIGLWIDNHHDLYCENLSAVGYWRMAGAFGRTSIPIYEDPSPDFERNKFLHCRFQGFSSFLLRGSDLYDIKAVGPDWIEIEWFDQHPFDPAFDNTFRTQEYGGLFCSYTGTTKNGSNLRITGVSPSPAAIDVNNSTNRVIMGRRTNGVADATWDNCYFYGMSHRAYRATSAQFGSARYNTPSRCIEISGASIRGLKFNDSCKTITGDDIGLYLGNTLQFEYNGSFESKNIEGYGSGIRNVASTNSYQIRLGQRCRGSGGIDMRPAYATTDGRFTTVGDTGLFNPNQVLWDGWSYGINGHVDIRPGNGQRVGFTDENGVPTLYRTSLGDYGFLDGNNVRILRYEAATDIWTTTADQHMFNNRAGEKRAWLTANDANLYGQVTRLYNADASVVMFRLDAGTTTLDVAGRIRPDTDGTRNLGDSAKRWSVVYASTGTINTSDATMKSPVFALTTAELNVGIRLAREIGTYMWLDSVEEKEGGARLHVGMTVQKAIEIFASEGLDPFRYGCICYDEWDDEYQEDDGVTSLVVAAGARFGFREGELHGLMLRGLAYQLDSIEARLAALEL